MSETTEKQKEQTFCWVCRFCGTDGPWQTDSEKVPKGWIKDEERGVCCPKCK